MELKYQFDVCDGEGDLSAYRLLVLPDHVEITEPLQGKLQEHLRKGGILISSAFAGLNREKTGFALDEYGLTYEGPESHDPTFFTAKGGIGHDIPEMAIAIYNQGITMRAQEGSAILARLHKPYFNKGSWDWYHENMYTPPEMDAGRPALVRRGNIFHFSFPIFQGYCERATVAHRTLLRNCIESVLPDPLVRVENVPSFGQVTVTQRGKSRMVHILAYVPELPGQQQMIEEAILVKDIELGLRDDGHQVKEVYLAPRRKGVPFCVEDGYIRVRIPEIQGYQMVVFEFE